MFLTPVNHWEAPSYLVNFEDRSLRNGMRIRGEIRKTVQDILEDWVKLKLSSTSVYGVRIYTEGAILTPHVDRNPLITSAIINVEQDVDEPWPLEVYDHQGVAHNVTMVPGDLVLYESHSVVHGRPFPLVGREFANVFVHYEPAGGDYKVDGGSERKKEKNREGKKIAQVQGSTPLNKYAQLGDLAAIRDLVEGEDDNALASIHAADHNGWQAIHEAARAGHLHVLEYLVEKGANINGRTNAGLTPTEVMKVYSVIDEVLKSDIVGFFHKSGAEL